MLCNVLKVFGWVALSCLGVSCSGVISSLQRLYIIGFIRYGSVSILYGSDMGLHGLIEGFWFQGVVYWLEGWDCVRFYALGVGGLIGGRV